MIRLVRRTGFVASVEVLNLVVDLRYSSMMSIIFNKFIMDDGKLLCSNCDKILTLADNNIDTFKHIVQYLQ